MVTAISHGDVKQAADLFDWIYELEQPRRSRAGQPARFIKHPLLIVSSKGVDYAAVKKAASRAFAHLTIISPKQSVEWGWPVSANYLFRTAYDWVKRNHRGPWWWHEPDCIPVRRGWLDALDWQYRRKKRPFLGVIYHRPFKHLTGCAVYPPNIEAYNPESISGDSSDAWDCVAVSKTLPHAHHTRLLQHEWGNISNNIAPTFPNQRSLGLIRSGAYLFHRNKDGSLIERLRERRAEPFKTRWRALREPAGNGFQNFHEHVYSRPKKLVHDVTLVAIDGRSDCRATARAMIRAGDQMAFDQCLLLSPDRPEILPPWIIHKRIGPMDLSGYNRFCLAELYKHIDLRHCLTVQADSGINNPDAWQEAWKEWDFIGAPWPRGWAWDEFATNYQRVGNSGMCLRSRRWLEATNDLPTVSTRFHGQLIPRCVDDIIPCVNYRHVMIKRGMRTAPVEVAARFSFEQPTVEAPRLNGQFAFHLHKP